MIMITKKLNRVDLQRLRRLICVVRAEVQIPLDDPRGRELQRQLAAESDKFEKMLFEYTGFAPCGR